MPQLEWFYAKNDQPCGPVSAVELKQFAERGELREEDLVWREGMVEWIPASKIKGLFSSNGEGAVESEQAGEQEVVVRQTPPRGEVPGGAIPNPPPAAAELPIRFSPASDRAVAKPEPKIEPQVRERILAEPRPFRHPLDILADAARGLFSARFVHSTVVLFRVGGQVGVFLAIVAVGFLGVAFGAKTGTLAVSLPLAAGGVVGLLLAQYVALHLSSAMEKLDRSVRAGLSVTGPFDGLAAVMTVAGMASLVGLSGLAMGTSTVWPVFLAMTLFIVCQFTAIVAWNPKAVWLDVGPASTPGREVGGQVCFLGKLLWRLSVVAYGTGIMLGSIATLNVAVHIGLPEETHYRWFGAELYVPLGLLLAAVPLPAAGYVSFLACQFLSELVAKPTNWGRRR
ncbi:MAG: DUF4339 domain-containing protein [Planctomycetaceae bacterium]|jgi:hypothetical protein|nr:DUF4339 domain-containing protein [Planctomycetaceae bacterium]